MKALLLAYKKISKSEKYYLRLKEELEQRFDKVMYGFIDYVTIQTDNSGTKVCHKSMDIAEEFDAVIPRFGPSYAKYGQLILEHLNNKVYVPNTPSSYSICNDKFRTLMHLQRAGISVPHSRTSINLNISKKLCEKVGKPIIIKKTGLGGKGVVYAKDIASANSVIDALEIPAGDYLVIEEFIKANNEDIRFFVVGDKVVASMKRTAQNGDVRSNLHAGGKGEIYVGKPIYEEIAVRAAKAVGAGIAGVDIMLHKNKPYVLEVNMNPGFAISDVTNKNIFANIADYVYDNTKNFLREKKHQKNLFYQMQHIFNEITKHTLND